MARPPLLNEYWEHVLRLEALCQREGLRPNSAAEQIAYRVPGPATLKSKKRLLLKYHADHRDQVRWQLELGRQWPPLTLGSSTDLGTVLVELQKTWLTSDTAKQLRQLGQETENFRRVMREWAVESDVWRAQSAVWWAQLIAPEIKNHTATAG